VIRARTSRVVAAVCGVVLLQLSVPSVFGCGMSDSQGAPPELTYVTAERAVIIWDSVHHVEHFIRQAIIHTQDPDLGFLVPTPQPPDISGVSPSIFNGMAANGNPSAVSAPVNFRSPWGVMEPVMVNPLLQLDRLSPSALFSALSGRRADARNSVLFESDVAQYHATVLGTENQDALAAWLSQNGYRSTPELRAWLQGYVRAHWYLTAFKLVKTDFNSDVINAAVRMSFTTTRPFYPYSEPSDRQQPGAASPDGRALRVTILGDHRMTGSLADQSAWPGRIEYSGPLADPASANQRTVREWLNLAGLYEPENHVSIPTTITTMIDQSNPRPGTADLFFSTDADQSPFQGSAVDLDAGRQTHWIIAHPFQDGFAIALLFLLPVVPIYCGWKILHFVPAKAAKTRQPSTPLSTCTSPLGFIFGPIAIAAGAFFGVQFLLTLIGQIASAVLGWSAINTHWFLVESGLLLASIPVIAMSCGLVYCGLNVSGALSKLRWKRAAPFFVLDGAEWQGFMAASSMLAGGVFLLMLLEVFYPFMTS
jgi:hypothetical protein